MKKKEHNNKKAHPMYYSGKETIDFNVLFRILAVYIFVSYC